MQEVAKGKWRILSKPSSVEERYNADLKEIANGQVIMLKFGYARNCILFLFDRSVENSRFY